MKKIRTIALFTMMSLLCGCTQNQQLPDEQKQPVIEEAESSVPDEKEEPSSEKAEQPISEEAEQPVSEEKEPSIPDEKEQPISEEKVELPTQYNLMDYGRAKMVQSQGSTNSCWAYAAINSAESSILTNGLAGPDLNLSEAHLVYYTTEYADSPKGTPSQDGNYIFVKDREHNAHGFDLAGGYVTTAALWASGVGPVHESDLPTFKNGSKEEIHESADALVAAEQEGTMQKYMGDFLLKEGLCYDIKDSESVKCAIMEKGAMTIGISNNTTYYSDNCAYYDPNQSATNHLVTIIGWDDTYPKENFGKHKPSKNGAWLALDSAPVSYNGDGYLWISYEDQSLADAFLFNLCDRNEYGDILYYDTFGGIFPLGSEEKYTTIANIFPINGEEELKAVGFYTFDPSREVEISIYTGVTEGIPDSGTCRTEFTLTPERDGYHLIDLEKTIPVSAGESCSVIIKYRNDDGLGKAFVEGWAMSIPGGVVRIRNVHSEKGESFVSLNGEWLDLSEKSTGEAFGYPHALNNASIKLLLK